MEEKVGFNEPEPKKKCKHVNCLVHHLDGECNCDMTPYCFECSKE